MAPATWAVPLSMMRKTTSRKPKNAATISDVEMVQLPARAVGVEECAQLRSPCSTLYQQTSFRWITSFRCMPPPQLHISTSVGEQAAPSSARLAKSPARPLKLRMSKLSCVASVKPWSGRSQGRHRASRAW